MARLLGFGACGGGGTLEHPPSDLAKLPEATTSVLVSINLATTLLHLISVITAIGTLPRRTITRDPGHDRSTATVKPNCCQLIVSITESLMNNVCCTGN